jgi:hypothetical protein
VDPCSKNAPLSETIRMTSNIIGSAYTVKYIDETATSLLNQLLRQVCKNIALKKNSYYEN